MKPESPPDQKQQASPNLFRTRTIHQLDVTELPFHPLCRATSSTPNRSKKKKMYVEESIRRAPPQQGQRISIHPYHFFFLFRAKTRPSGMTRARGGMTRKKRRGRERVPHSQPACENNTGHILEPCLRGSAFRRQRRIVPLSHDVELVEEVGLHHGDLVDHQHLTLRPPLLRVPAPLHPPHQLRRGLCVRVFFFLCRVRRSAPRHDR